MPVTFPHKHVGQPVVEIAYSLGRLVVRCAQDTAAWVAAACTAAASVAAAGTSVRDAQGGSAASSIAAPSEEGIVP